MSGMSTRSHTLTLSRPAMFERAQKQEKKARCRSTRRGAFDSAVSFFILVFARQIGGKQSRGA